MQLNLYFGRQRKLVPICISNLYLQDTYELKKWLQIVTVLVHMLCCHFKISNIGADGYTAMKRMACNNSRWKAANQSKDQRVRGKKKPQVYMLHVFRYACHSFWVDWFWTAGDRYFSTDYCFKSVWPNIVMSRSVTSASSKGVHSQNFTCICNKKLNNCA
jgi:hypothetical protein